MCCVECGRAREPNERGWVVVFAPRDKPGIRYCPECIAAIIRGASSEDEQD